MVKLLLLLIALTACSISQDNVADPNAQCQTNADCAVAGCSGEICIQSEMAADLVTICEYKEEYQCLELSNCGCYEGKCAWEQNSAYTQCLEQFK